MLKSGLTILVPVDFYVAISRNRKRLLEVPTVIFHSGRTKAFRLEAVLFAAICIIVDFKPVTFGGNTQQKDS